MQIAYIKFNNRADQIRGFYELATKAQVTSLPGGVYAVPWKALALLDEETISYRRATDAEVPLKHGAIRAPLEPTYANAGMQALWERTQDRELVQALARGTSEEARWRSDGGKIAGGR